MCSEGKIKPGPWVEEADAWPRGRWVLFLTLEVKGGP